MKGLLEKFGGAWYIETIFKGLFLLGLGLFAVFSPLWTNVREASVIGQIMVMLIGAFVIWTGVCELLSAKKKKNLEDTYVDPW